MGLADSGLTIGSDWRMADWNREDAEGIASMPRIMFAPELWPASVILEVLPPKLGRTFFKKFNEVMMSLAAKFVCPLGAMSPSCNS